MVVVVLSLGTAGCGVDWAMFGFDSTGARYNPGETAISTANVGHLSTAWTASPGNSPTGSPAIVNGVAYVSDGSALYAFSANGSTGCTGVAKTCTPLWKANLFGPTDAAVVNGIVYAVSRTYPGSLAAFDAAGSTGCLGSPKICTPLWTAPLTYSVSAPPTVANGVAYVGAEDGKLSAFDAAGTTGCSGSPKTCTPLWTAATGATGVSAPAIAGGRAFVFSNDLRLYAFDAAGSQNCLFVPKICTPLWKSENIGPFAGAPAVANGTVYVASTYPIRPARLWAFDATGSTGCSGAPVTCTPKWSAPLDQDFVFGTAPAIANGVVYVGFGKRIMAVDATGTANCSGTPKQCGALWAWTTGGSVGTPAIANGYVYAGSSDGKFSAFGACNNPESTVGLAPCDIQNAYRLPSTVGGSGRTVAIVDAQDNPNAESDLAVYRSTFGLPPCTTWNGCFAKVNQNGQQSNYPPADGHWAFEISLDLDMVSATCPNCRILLVEANDSQTGTLAYSQDVAAILGANVISDSFGIADNAYLEGLDPHYLHAGITTVASAGDDGYNTFTCPPPKQDQVCGGPQYPAAVPGVVSVGGTTLTAGGSARGGWSESVWNQHAVGRIGGSGCSVGEPKPAWQHDIWCANRMIADVAAAAQNLAVYDTYPNPDPNSPPPGWMGAGGTSASAPIVASIVALTGSSGGPDFTPNYIYSTNGAASLFDVTTGNNGTCFGTNLCNATVGYDGPTGLGTPCGTFGGGTACTGPASSPGAAQATPRSPNDGASYVPNCPPASPGEVTCFSWVRSPTKHDKP